MSQGAAGAPARWRFVAWLLAGTAWLLSAGAVAALVSTGTTPLNVADWVMDVVTSAVYGGVVLLMLQQLHYLLNKFLSFLNPFFQQSFYLL